MNAYDPLRRLFLQRAALTGAGAVLLLAGCGGGDKPAAEATGQAGPAANAGAAAPGPRSCDDLTGLTPSQIQVRESFEYVEQAEDPALACRLCEFWKAPAAGTFCGGCTLFAGPVNPEGSCNSFSEA
ncbi:MAG: hypothetical protein ABR506_04425 [Candidatus Krumholzibacteriia bacterium]